MKFTINSKTLHQKVSLLRKVTQGSRLQHKALMLDVSFDEVRLFTQSESMYAEVIITTEGSPDSPSPVTVEAEGRIEIGIDSFNFAEYVLAKTLTFELEENQLWFSRDTGGYVNIAEVEPKYIERPAEPYEWVEFTDKDMGVFDILYAADDASLSYRNVFISGDVIATTNLTRFAGYRHHTTLTEKPVTVMPELFSVIPKEPFKLGFADERIWVQSGNFFVSSPLVAFNNPVITKMGWHDIGTDYFEISLEDVERMMGYVNSFSASTLNGKDGWGTLTVMGGQVSMLAPGNSYGKGVFGPIECRSSNGNFIVSVLTYYVMDARRAVDAPTFKCYVIENGGALLLVGTKTRHFFATITTPPIEEKIAS